MYKIEDNVIQDLENIINCLNQLEIKGIQNNILIANIFNILQNINGKLIKLEESLKTSNLPITNKEEKRNDK
jgi:hypothetical protein